MPKGIEVGVAVDTRAAKRGLETGLIEPLEDAQSALDDLGKSRGPDQLERSLEDAQDATEKLKRETKETADAIEDEYRKGYRKAKESADDFQRGSSEAVGEFKSEALSNFSEVTSSFDGSMSSIQDLAQGTLGGLASSGLPGIGVAAGAAAVGVGLIGGALENVQKEAEETAERVNDMYEDMTESGQAFLSQEFIDKGISAIIGDDAKFDKAKADAEELGVTWQTVVKAQAGDQAALNSVIAAGEQLRRDEVAAIEQSSDTLESKSRRIDGVNVKYGEILETYRDINGEAQRAVEKANAYRDATQEAAGADQKRYEALARATAKVPAEVRTKLTVDTSEAEASIQRFSRSRTLDLKIRATDPYGRIY